MMSCQPKEQKQAPRKVIDYIKKIPGPSDTIPQALAQKGEVLIAYADCYTCHTEDKRSKGPAFKDIAKRYPVKPVYIDLLAQKIISGGFGSWGNPVMSPHPNLSKEDAQLMVTYILSLKEK
ncbi:MAG: c-type cytochrome [Sphingobacteriaceae bacterium]